MAGLHVIGQRRSDDGHGGNQRQKDTQQHATFSERSGPWMFCRSIAAVVHMKAGFGHFVICARATADRPRRPGHNSMKMPGFIHELVCIAL
jgi:hypothetical protein